MKTCKYGHPRTEENIIRNKQGYIHDCRPCSRIRSVEKYRNYSLEDRQKANALSREGYHRNREKRLIQHRTNVLKRKYGLTREEYDNLFINQEFLCANKGCGADLSTVNPHVDHCHKTGKVRGILCGPCNMALGQLRDSVDVIQGLAEYLKINS